VMEAVVEKVPSPEPSPEPSPVTTPLPTPPSTPPRPATPDEDEEPLTPILVEAIPTLARRNAALREVCSHTRTKAKTQHTLAALIVRGCSRGANSVRILKTRRLSPFETSGGGG